MFTSPTRCDQFLTFETSQTVLHWLPKETGDLCSMALSLYGPMVASARV